MELLRTTTAARRLKRRPDPDPKGAEAVRRKVTLEAGQAARVATASATLTRGVEETSGQVLGCRAVTERIGWAISLVQRMATRLLDAHWNPQDVARLAAGSDPAGRPLPPQAWMASRRLGWTVTVPEADVRVNDRVVRMAQETAGRLLRSAVWRAGLLDAVLATWPQDPARRTPEEWDALRATVPDGRAVATGILRARTRQVAAFLQRYGWLPADLFELEDPPHAPRQLPLAACDRQQATITRCPDDPHSFAVLRLKLPTRADPRSYRDWTWVRLRFRLPPTVPGDAALHLPTLRTRDGKARTDVAFTHAVPAATRTGHTVALGVDWGLNVLLTAGVVRLTKASAEDPDGNSDDRLRCVTDNHTVMFRAAGILAKADRVRQAGEAVTAKTNQQQLLLDGRAAHGLPEDAALQAKHGLLVAERDRIAARRRQANTALANSCAAWLVGHALAAGASVIYFEDLRDLEARGKGRNLNTRLSQTVRGQIVAATRHAADQRGIAVVTVPARETSKRCPRCLTALKHSKAPDRPTVRGWKWATCPGCCYTGDRDAGAWQRIAARGLLHQHQTVADRASGQLLVRSVDPKLDARSTVQVQARPGGTPVGGTVTVTASASGPGTGQPSGRPGTNPNSRPARRRLRKRTRAARRSRPPLSSASRGTPRASDTNRKRRTAPSPRRPGNSNKKPGGCGQRPEGRAPQDRPGRSTAGQVQAAASTTSAGGRCVTIGTAPRSRHRKQHRPRGARLGAGFHLGAHATRPGTGLGPGGRRC